MSQESRTDVKITKTRRDGVLLFVRSLLIFGIPGVLIYLGVHYLVPVLVNAGVTLIFAWSACVLVPTVANAAVVVGHYVWRERPSGAAFKKRFRLEPLPLRHLLLVPVVAFVILVCNEALAWTIPLLAELPGFGPAPITPEIFTDPYATLEAGSQDATFMGVPLRPENAWLAAFWLIWVVFGVLGEEIVWRGYLLPLHEAHYGRWAWLVNGLLWNVPFHLYTLSNVLADTPFFLILPFVTQRVKNTYFAVFVHALMVSLAYVLIVPGVWPS